MKLKDFQKSTARELVKIKKGVLCFDCGMGKSVTALKAVDELKKFNSLDFTYVVCPPSLISHWKQEIKKFGYDESSFKVVSSFKKDYKVSENSAIIFDESHLFASNAWKHLERKGVKAKCAFMLTGTPVVNTLEDIYFSLKICGKFPKGYSRNHFKMEFLGGYIPFGKRYVVAKHPTNIKRLAKLFNSVCFVKKRKLNVRKIKVDLGKGPELDWSDIKTFSLNSRSYGFFKVNNEKTRKTLVKLTKRHRKFIIFYFHELIGDEIVKQVEKYKSEKEESFDVLRLSGKVSPDKRSKLIDKFESSDDAVFVCQYGVAGQGFNIESAEAVVFLESTWSPFKDKQCYMRAYRMSRKKTLTVYYIFYKGERKLFVRGRKSEQITKFLKEVNMAKAKKANAKKAKGTVAKKTKTVSKKSKKSKKTKK